MSCRKLGASSARCAQLRAVHHVVDVSRHGERNKVSKTIKVADAVALIPDGAVPLIGGFMGSDAQAA